MLVVLVVALTLSCSASHPPDAPIEVGDFERDLCAPVSESLCARAEACGCGALVHGGVLDHDACVARMTARCLETNASFVDAGIVAERRLVREYLAAVAELAPCEDVRIPWERGLAFFPVEIGARCPFAHGYCAGSAGVCGSGHCFRRPTDGDECRFGVCAVGSTCRETDADSICAPLGSAGESCDFLDDADCAFPMRCGDTECLMPIPDGDACGSSARGACAAGSSCVDGSCTVRERGACPCAAGETCVEWLRTCRAGGAVGDSCGTDRECAAGLWCDPPIGRCATRIAEGGECPTGLLACADGLRCLDGACAPLALAGEPCTDGRALECAGGLTCIDGACAAARRAGEPCTYLECADDLVCFGDPATCQPPPGEGEPCARSSLCASGLHCAGEVCVRDRPAGARCDSFEDPCEGACVRDRTGGLTCVDAPGEGDPCGEHEDCPAGLQCAGELRCVPTLCELWSPERP
ncbi:MAG: hypothetical protein M3Y87_20055 [Myxococcota bacterium]|nr:hypothetical protein [Myxococcota bacterium]